MMLNIDRRVRVMAVRMAVLEKCLVGCHRFLRERYVSGQQALCTRSERSATLHTLLDILSSTVAVGSGVRRRRTDLLQPVCT